MLGMVMMTLAGLSLLGLLGYMVFWVPRYEAIYGAFGARLPVPVRLILTTSHLVRQVWPAAVIGIVVVGLMAMPLARPSWTWLWLGGVILLISLLAGVLTYVALEMPLKVGPSILP